MTTESTNASVVSTPREHTDTSGLDIALPLRKRVHQDDDTEKSFSGTSDPENCSLAPSVIVDKETEARKQPKRRRKEKLNDETKSEEPEQSERRQGKEGGGHKRTKEMSDTPPTPTAAHSLVPSPSPPTSLMISSSTTTSSSPSTSSTSLLLSSSTLSVAASQTSEPSSEQHPSSQVYPKETNNNEKKKKKKQKKHKTKEKKTNSSKHAESSQDNTTNENKITEKGNKRVEVTAGDDQRFKMTRDVTIQGSTSKSLIMSSSESLINPSGSSRSTLRKSSDEDSSSDSEADANLRRAFESMVSSSRTHSHSRNITHLRTSVSSPLPLVSTTPLTSPSIDSFSSESDTVDTQEDPDRSETLSSVVTTSTGNSPRPVPNVVEKLPPSELSKMFHTVLVHPNKWTL
jgi:hypothetical protein